MYPRPPLPPSLLGLWDRCTFRFNLSVSDLWCTVKCKGRREGKTFTAIFLSIFWQSTNQSLTVIQHHDALQWAIAESSFKPISWAVGPNFLRITLFLSLPQKGNKVTRFQKNDSSWCCNKLEEYIPSQRNVSINCAFCPFSHVSKYLRTLQNHPKGRPNNHSTQLLADPLLRNKSYIRCTNTSIELRNK